MGFINHIRLFFAARRFELGVLFGFLALVSVVYGGTMAWGFFSDDFHHLFVTADGQPAWWYFMTNIIGERGGSSYGPIFNVLLAIEYALFGLFAPGWHAASVFLHGVTGFFVFLTGRKITKSDLIGLTAGVLFLVLPSRTEAVGWIAGQPHLLATLFYLVGIYWYLVFLHERKSLHYTLALLAALLSLFTKEIGVTIFGAFFLLEIWDQSRRSGDFNREFLISLVRRLSLPGVLFCAYLLLRWYATGQLGGYYGGQTLAFDLAPMMRMFVELSVGIFFPHPYRAVAAVFIMQHLIAAVIMVGVFFFFLFKKAGAFRRPLFLFFALYLVSVLPFLQLELNHSHNGGERYTYLPSLFAALLVAAAVSAFFRITAFRYRSVGIMVVVIAALFLPFHPGKNASWQSASSVVQGITQSYPEARGSGGDYLIFVGLPDTVGGAEAFRNAIREAIVLTYKQSLPAGERIPIYTALQSETAIKQKFNLEKQDEYRYILRAEGGGDMFTGFSSFTNDLATFALLPGSRPERGSGIMIEFNAAELERMQRAGQNVRMMYYSEGRLAGRVIE